MNKINVRLRRAREKKGYSQDFMAESLGVSQATYARMESGNTKLSIERLYEMAQILECEITEFFTSAKKLMKTRQMSKVLLAMVT